LGREKEKVIRIGGGKGGKIEREGEIHGEKVSVG